MTVYALHMAFKKSLRMRIDLGNLKTESEEENSQVEGFLACTFKSPTNDGFLVLSPSCLLRGAHPRSRFPAISIQRLLLITGLTPLCAYQPRRFRMIDLSPWHADEFDKLMQTGKHLIGQIDQHHLTTSAKLECLIGII